MLAILLAAHFGAGVSAIAAPGPVIVGSKKFTESYVLGEIAKQALAKAGIQVEHRQGMGATIILWEALKQGSITCYPEYTGTIREEILKSLEGASMDQVRAQLAKWGVGMSGELGFNNTYALLMRRDRARQLQITRISDLKQHPELMAGLTHEFLDRQDGWAPLCRHYGLKLPDVRGIDHTLGYEALATGKIDIKDAYSTDAKAGNDAFLILKDDLDFFPQYRAVFLFRLDSDPAVAACLNRLTGTLNEERMIRLNAVAERTRDYSFAASLFFEGESREQSASLVSNLVRWTARHLVLVGLSLLVSILIGLPLGIWASRPGAASRLILGVAGLVQTIPSLALLALLVSIPFLGITPLTAIVALFLYGLLPIVRNTASGIQDITPALRESAAALGLEPRAQMIKVFLPLASRSILAGIETSAIISVGTATLAALIGAGGLGEPIISGLNLNDRATILEGAIPAALLALLVQASFDLLERCVIPRGLRLGAASR
jgi:osmoprotectant transport system permease protein